MRSARNPCSISTSLLTTHHLRNGNGTCLDEPLEVERARIALLELVEVEPDALREEPPRERVALQAEQAPVDVLIAHLGPRELERLFRKREVLARAKRRQRGDGLRGAPR